MSYRQKIDQGYLSFAKGLVTEYNPLAPPEGTTSDELNMDLDTDGLVRVRRAPLEALSAKSLSGTEGVIVYSAVWEDINRIVVLVKRNEVDTETGNVLVDMIIYQDTGTEFINELVLYFSIPQVQYVQPSMTFLRQRALLILGGAPVLVEQGTTSYNVLNIKLLIRDFKLLDDGYGTSIRPAVLEDSHKYNLYNAGWWQHRKLKSTDAVGDPVEDFYDVRARYPGNADISYLGDTTNAGGDLVFSPAGYDNIDFGSTEAPRGHYIYSIIDIDRNQRIFNKILDGSSLATIVPIVEDGNDPDTGSPPLPDEPIVAPPGFCDRFGEGGCTEIP